VEIDPKWFEISRLPLARLLRRPLRARFRERPNRFVARVVLPDGRCVTAHLPNPGRLTGTLLPGCEVLLDGPHAPPRICGYTVVAVREGRTVVGTVTTYANLIFAELWRRGAFPELPNGALSAEVVRGTSRFDFQAGGTLVEVKSVTLARGRRALFPDAVTARGARHCDELARLAGRGVSAAVVFVAQRNDVDSVEPAGEIDPGFAEALRRAAAAGVSVLACAAEITAAGARRARRIPVVLR
jgi:sugar fermentation stimulation protein A